MKSYYQLFFFVLIIIVSCKNNGQKQVPDTKPNIVFILSDDHAPAAISAYGDKIMHTPNIDRIAENGMLFENTFVVSSLCAPSRAAIFNSQYGAKSGFKRIGDVFDGSGNTLPNLLQQANYQTAIFGKWHLKSQPIGFNYYELVFDQGLFFDPVFYKTGQEWAKENGGSLTKGYFSDIITDRSIQWLEQRNADQPFALFIHYKAPHAPHITPEKYDSLFVEDLPVPKTFYDDFADNNSSLREEEQPYSKLQNAYESDVYNSIHQKTAPEGTERGTPEYKRWAYQTMFKGYYRQVANMDDNIGRVLDYLEENDLTENTIIIYTSDNGWFLGDHGLFNKMWMHEESIRIPFLMSYGKQVKAKSKNADIISSIDFAPTLLDYAGVEIPETMYGKSFRKILEGETPDDWRTSFFYHYFDQFGVPEMYGIRTHDFKLIKVLKKSGDEYEMFDLKNDPEELINLADNPDYQQLKEKLIQQMEVEKAKFEN